MAKFWHQPARFAKFLRQWPESSSQCRQIPVHGSQNRETFGVNLGRQQTPMSNSSEFLQTCVQENEEFKFIKRFIIFKTVNRFQN